MAVHPRRAYKIPQTIAAMNSSAATEAGQCEKTIKSPFSREEAMAAFRQAFDAVADNTIGRSA